MSLIGALRAELSAIDSGEAISGVQTMEAALSASLASARATVLLLAVFAALALAVAAVGVYGVMSYSVTQRTHELAIRMALGARASDVVELVVWQGLRLCLLGVAIGLAGALA